MSDSAPSNRGFNPVRHLIVLAVIMVLMYQCTYTLRFTNDALNLAFEGVFYLLPLLAIRPALGLPRFAKSRP
jgi:hypothetical protein